ncbi:MAG TPA: hypothetical protein PK280_06475 [Planctomycetota bacterium]|nr:hypothetical protein [Planctomycetota bacterium]
MASPADPGDRAGSALLGELVSSGRLRPEEAALLQEEVLLAEKRGAARAGTVLSWITTGLALVLCLSQLLWPVVLPGFMKLFADMALGELPLPTRLLLTVPWWVYTGAFLTLAILIPAKEALIRNKAVTMALNVITIFGLMLWAAFAKWALFAPMMTMMERLGQDGRGC